MDFEYLIIGVLLIGLGVLIFMFKAETYKPNQENEGFGNYSIISAVLLLMLGVFYIYKEVIKLF